MTKKERRELARKKATKKKILAGGLYTAIALAIIALLVFISTYSSDTRTFTDGNQAVTLRDNGTFEAHLAHSKSIKGTYREDSSASIIIFSHDSVTATGSLENGILTIPDDWDDHHGHGSVLVLQQ